MLNNDSNSQNPCLLYSLPNELISACVAPVDNVCALSLVDKKLNREANLRFPKAINQILREFPAAKSFVEKYQKNHPSNTQNNNTNNNSQTNANNNVDLIASIDKPKELFKDMMFNLHDFAEGLGCDILECDRPVSEERMDKELVVSTELAKKVNKAIQELRNEYSQNAKDQDRCAASHKFNERRLKMSDEELIRDLKRDKMSNEELIKEFMKKRHLSFNGEL